MIKRILIGLSGTPNTAAEVQHGIELARAHQAHITAITVVDLQRHRQRRARAAGRGQRRGGTGASTAWRRRVRRAGKPAIWCSANARRPACAAT